MTMLTGNVFSQLIPFVLAPILARIFTPNEFAVLANFMAIVGMLGIVATARLELAIPIPKDNHEAQGIAFTGFTFTLLLGVLSLLIPIFSDQIGQLYHDNILPSFLWLVPVSIISMGFLGLSNNWGLRQQKFKSISIGKIAQSLINNGLAAILGYWGWGINGLIIAWLLSQFVNIAILSLSFNIKVQLKSFGKKTVIATLQQYRDFPLINTLHAFTDVFITQFLFFWIISVRFGQTELGYFAVMNKYVRAPIILITSSVAQLYYTESGKFLQENKSPLQLLNRTLRTTIIFAIPFTIILLLWAPVLFEWYLGAQWIQAGVYARCLAPLLFLMFIVSPISGTPILMKRQKSAFVFSLIGYAFSFGAFGLAVLANYSFSTSLWFYSISYGLYQLALLIWYRKLVTT